MGYIYKITNRINGHSYIGQTRNDIASRFNAHYLISFNPNSDEYDYAIHSAIRQYGKNNFIIEQLEECDDNLLNEKEKYWIEYYDTYYHGYNETLGGEGHCKYNYDEIVNYYLSHNFSIKDTCLHFNIYDQIVYTALKNKHIDYKTLNKRPKGIKKVGKKILLVEENIIFNTMSEIDSYFGKQVHGNVRRCLNGVTKKAYGYTWKELEE